MYQKLKTSSPFFLVAGLNVLESYSSTLRTAIHLQEVCKELKIEFIFKASFDKANRSNESGFRGPGLVVGIEQLQRLKKDANVKIVTDIHEREQCNFVKHAGLDMIQIPSFLCRQTDLLHAAAATGLPILLKKGQFASVDVMHAAREKIFSQNKSAEVLLCERGTSLGADQLFVDFRNLVLLRSRHSLVVLDCTHAAQKPAANVKYGKGSSGDLFAVKAYARAGVAVGIDGLFMEVHENPSKAPVDSKVQYPLEHVREFLKELCDIGKASKGKQDNTD